MKTKKYLKEDLDEIVAVIKNNGTIAIPTDTVYGLAVIADQEREYQKLKEIKGRPDDKPFPLMVADFEQLENCVEMNDLIRHLVRKFMPGAVTFIFKRRVDKFTFLGKQETLGIRMADDAWVQKLIRRVGSPIWLPSANRSGEDTAISSKMVLAQLEGLIDGVIVGETKAGVSSSIFDLTTLPIKQLRNGKITLEDIEKECNKYLENEHKSVTITRKD